MCIVIVCRCVLLLYVIVYCYCISLFNVIVSHCLLYTYCVLLSYSIVYCHCYDTIWTQYCVCTGSQMPMVFLWMRWRNTTRWILLAGFQIPLLWWWILLFSSCHGTTVLPPVSQTISCKGWGSLKDLDALGKQLVIA